MKGGEDYEEVFKFGGSSEDVRVLLYVHGIGLFFLEILSLKINF
ncbi:MAG: hypothetical protein Q4C14_07920 [Bacillota bacterium]|nr:hypothetical protein [Bacillota bacterium]